MIVKLVLALFWLSTALILFTTLAPLTKSQAWWIRGWDFPRLHIALFASIALALGLFVLSKSVAVAMIALSLCTIYQGYRVFPFTRWATPEIALSPDIKRDEQISLISANVLMENTHHDAVGDMIQQENPDVLFLMETDQAWSDALDPVLDSFDTVLRHPLDNHYGLIFATNLTAHSVETVFLSDDETPTLLAELEGPTGRFFFVGLHPRPPVPGQDTHERDAQIRRAAQVADRERLPVVAMGDFNDVAWSRTSERFKEYGSFRDPRVGRGMLPSFDAQSWWMRFPIDQLYLTDGLALISFDRLSAGGSDHFPMRAVISVEGEDER